jgi:hypothetical protein
MYGLSVFCSLALAGLLLHRIIVCNLTRAWHHNPTADCYLGNAVGIINVSSMLIDIISVPLKFILIEVL